MELILSLFPGIGLLDKGFEAAGFCVVRGPDLIYGGDIRNFTAPPDMFTGIIGGSPCQDFSKARRCPPTGDGLEMIKEFKRVIMAARPEWYISENVPGVPDIKITGYNWQRLDLRASYFGLKQRRLRHIQFGSTVGHNLCIERPDNETGTLPTATANDDRTIQELAELQGLPPNFDIPAFTRGALTKAIGNGVPYPMALAIAQAVINRGHHKNLCGCGCGRKITGKSKTASGACRKRLHDRKLLAA